MCFSRRLALPWRLTLPENFKCRGRAYSPLPLQDARAGEELKRLHWPWSQPFPVLDMPNAGPGRKGLFQWNKKMFASCSRHKTLELNDKSQVQSRQVHSARCFCFVLSGITRPAPHRRYILPAFEALQRNASEEISCAAASERRTPWCKRGAGSGSGGVVALDGKTRRHRVLPVFQLA